MKKQIASICILLVLLISLSSCNKIETPSVSSMPNASQSPLPTEKTEREIIYDAQGEIDYDAMWPDKTVLVWLYFDSQGVHAYLGQFDNPQKSDAEIKPVQKPVYDSLITAYNDYLVSIGSNYVIRFESQPDELVEKIGQEYQKIDIQDKMARQLFIAKDIYPYFQQLLSDMKEQDKQVDLISACPITPYSLNFSYNGVLTQISGFAVDESGKQEISKGFMTDITDYIFKGEDSRLRDTYPDYYWNLFNKYDGIYGYYDNSLLSQNVLYLNEGIISGHDTKVLNSDITIVDLENFIDLLYQDNKEIVDNNEVTLFRNDTSYVEFQKLAGIHTYKPVQSDLALISFKYDFNGVAQVINRFKDADLLNLYGGLSRMVSKGYFNGSECKYQDAQHFFTNKDDVPAYYTLPSLTYIAGGYADYSNESSIGDYIPFQISDYFLRSTRSSLIGISSWSKNPDSAFDFLSTLLTDAHLSNLMMYGQGYEVIDGVAQQKPNYRIAILSVSHFVYPDRKGEKRYADLHKAIADAVIPPGFAFEPDYSGMDYDLEKIADLCKKADTVWGQEPENWEASLNDLVDLLEASGYDALLDEINIQYKEFCDNLLYKE